MEKIFLVTYLHLKKRISSSDDKLLETIRSMFELDDELFIVQMWDTDFQEWVDVDENDRNFKDKSRFQVLVNDSNANKVLTSRGGNQLESYSKSRAVGFSEYTRELEKIPVICQKLEKGIDEIIKKCEKVFNQVNLIAREMKESTRRGTAIKARLSAVGIAGGALCLAPVTGGLSLVGVVAGVVSGGGRLVYDWYENKNKEECVKYKDKCIVEFRERQTEFEADMNKLIKIRDRLNKASENACCDDGRAKMNEIFEGLLSCLGNAISENTSSRQKYDQLLSSELHFLFKVVVMRREGESESNIGDFIYQTMRLKPEIALEEFVSGVKTFGGKCAEQMYEDNLSWSTARATGGLGALTVTAKMANNCADAAKAAKVLEQMKIASAAADRAKNSWFVWLTTNAANDAAVAAKKATESAASASSSLARYGRTLNVAFRVVTVANLAYDIGNLVHNINVLKADSTDCGTFNELVVELKKQVQNLQNMKDVVSVFHNRFDCAVVMATEN